MVQSRSLMAGWRYLGTPDGLRDLSGGALPCPTAPAPELRLIRQGVRLAVER